MTAAARQMLSRAAALAILAALVILLLAATLWPVTQWLGNRSETIDNSLRLLTAYQHTVSLRPQIAQQLQMLKAQGGAVVGLIDGNSGAVAAANLQSQVKRIIDNNGAELRSAQNLPSSTVDYFEKIGMRFDLSASPTAMAEIFYQIETHTPYLFLDAVEIHGMEGSTVESLGAKEAKLTIRWDVYGYRWAGGP